MKVFRIIVTVILVYTLCGINGVQASKLTPAINELRLGQGQRSISSVKYSNEENQDLEIKASVYSYNPKTESIEEENANIFLKADTDTFIVKANSYIDIKYEIVPISNLEKGTYFNILVLSQVFPGQDVVINEGISHLVVLHITDPDGEVKGLTTQDYSVKIDVISKGIPFLKPLELKYIVENNSNYVITPQGRIDVFNRKGDYKPQYVYINDLKEKVYPKERIEETVKINKWYISDIFSQRLVSSNFYNGLDTTPKAVDIEVGSYTPEFLFALGVLVIVILLVKSLREDKKKN